MKLKWKTCKEESDDPLCRSFDALTSTSVLLDKIEKAQNNPTDHED